MSVAVHQALHGYDGGHRLLATSVEIDGDDERTIRVLSDLAGRQDDFPPGGYLTGYPLRHSRIYVLARTWPASEMPRPGSVWTHSLLIPIRALAELDSAEELLGLFVRPSSKHFESYSRPLSLDLLPARLLPGIRVGVAATLADAFYSNPAPVWVDIADRRDLDRLVLELWLQQWPRLKRTMTFCTSATETRRLDGRPFHLLGAGRGWKNISAEMAQPVGIDRAKSEAPRWATTAAMDMKERLPGFREWIGLGEAEANSRRDFRVLADLFTGLRNGEPLSEVGRIALAQWPGDSEASVIKRAILGPSPVAELRPDPVERLAALRTLGSADLDYEDLQTTVLADSVLESQKPEAIALVSEILAAADEPKHLRRALAASAVRGSHTEVFRLLAKTSPAALVWIAEEFASSIATILESLDKATVRIVAPTVYTNLSPQGRDSLLRHLLAVDALHILPEKQLDSSALDLVLALVASGEIAAWPSHLRGEPSPSGVRQHLDTQQRGNLIWAVASSLGTTAPELREFSSDSWRTALSLDHTAPRVAIAGYLALERYRPKGWDAVWVDCFQIAFRSAKARPPETPSWRVLRHELRRRRRSESSILGAVTEALGRGKTTSIQEDMSDDFAERFQRHGLPVSALPGSLDSAERAMLRGSFLVLGSAGGEAAVRLA